MYKLLIYTNNLYDPVIEENNLSTMQEAISRLLAITEQLTKDGWGVLSAHIQ